MYEFGPFRLDPVTRRLLRGENPVHLTSKSFDVLLFLVRRSGQVVDRDELLKAAWPRQGVEDSSLTVAVSVLRKALGETSHSRNYVETVARRGYRFNGRVKEIPADEQAAEGGNGRPDQLKWVVASIAVLPLINESETPESDYLCDGITESIIDSLAQLSTLKVIARSTAFHYRGREDAERIGEELGVQAVLTGRVRFLTDELILRARLVKVADGSQVWEGRYNLSLSDVLDVQEEIARDLSVKLRLYMTDAQVTSLGRRSTENTEAYHLYLKGRYLWNQFHWKAVERGIAYFNQAIAADPDYALAYSGLADGYLRLAAMYLPPKQLLPLAKEAALKAVEADETLAEARASLGLVKLWHDHDWAGAKQEYLRAIALNPNAVIPHQGYGSYLMFLGRFGDAVGEYEVAQEIDPLSLQLYVDLAAAHFMMRSFDEAHKQLTKALELEPGYYPARYAIAWVHVAEGRHEAALQELRLLCSAGEKAHMAQGLLGYISALSGERQAARRIHRDLERAAQRGYVAPYALTLSSLGAGDRERALLWIEEVYEERSYWLLWLNILPELAELRRTSRFKTVLRKAGFRPDKS